MTDEEIELWCPRILARVEATNALYQLLLAHKRKDIPHNYNYNEAEVKELAALHKRHLLRRIAEEAKKAGIDLGKTGK